MLRNRNNNYKFRRQYGIGRYIVDFYYPSLKLIIEVDGATHSTEEEVAEDKKRQTYIESLGFKINRYNNNEIYKNIDGVISSIINKCKEIDKFK